MPSSRLGISNEIFPWKKMHSPRRMHLWLAFFLHRDYFGRPDSSPACSFPHRDYFYRSDSSLACSFVPQGLFLSSRFIPSLLFFSTGIISIGQIHLWLALLFRRDYFGRLDSSLQADFLRCGCISAKYPSENVHHWAHRKRGCKKT